MSTTRRAYGNNKRPISAIFLGSTSSSSINSTISSSSSIPDLPEPPSPGAASNLSSTSSGLPSPPATNSTGSGSVGGDSRSNTAGGVRRRPALNQSASSRSMNSANGDGSRDSLDDPHDESGEYDDEDHTATFGVGKRKSTVSTASASSNDTVSALDRVKSLAKRNQEALEKLSGMRLGSPSPAFGRSARSPIPSSTSSTTSSVSNSSRLSSGSRPRAVNQATTSTYELKEATPSGSDTERESHHGDEFIERSVTPPPSARVRQRLLSAPDSPSKLRNSISAVIQRPSPLSPRSKRTSLGMNAVSDMGVRDVTNAALAAVASSRTSPTGRRSRQPLPQEFRQDSTSMDAITPHRNRSIRVSDPSGSSSGPPSVSPRLFRNSIRSATMRDISTRKTLRSTSEDISGQVIDEQEGSGYGAAQTRRSGSWESPVAQNRSLVGEGLKAAGLATRRREATDDVFRESVREPEERRLELVTSAGRTSVLGSRDRELDRDLEPRTPASAVRRELPRSLISSRPVSSMGGAYHDSPSSDGLRVSALKGKKSTPLMDVDRDLPLVRQPSIDRGYPSPYTGASRQLTGTPLSATRDRVASGEHGRLMMDSLSIFESHLSRLPPNGHTTTNTIPELFKAAQTIVQSTEKLNVLLRNGTNRALEEQISAEVSGELGEGSSELSEYWRTVGSDFRECLRASDDLVRNMTGFLLGVGKVLRETNASNVGTPSQHLRSVSLDDDVTARLNTEGAPTSGGRSSEGRRSVAGSRYSWEARLERPAGHDGSRDRPPSSFRDRRIEETPPQTTTSLQNPNLSSGSSSMRRFLALRDARDSPRSSTEEVTMEPSPSPAARVYGPQSGPQSIRALPPLVVPRPLPGLPLPSSDSENSLARKKISNGSVGTVRGVGQPTTFQPTVSTSTTAVSFPNLGRTNSSGNSPAVTFSRPSTISVFALNGLRQREREQRSRVSSAAYSSYDSESGGTGTGSSQVVNSPVSSVEPELPRERGGTFMRNRTAGKTVRMSLDGAVSNRDSGADHQPATTRGTGGTSTTRVKKNERRRTITEIFSGH